MKIQLRRLAGFLRGEDGTAAVEYAVLLALVFAAIVVTLGVFGTRVNDLWAAVVGAGW